MPDEDKTTDLFERTAQLDTARTTAGQALSPNQTDRPDGPVGLDIGTSHIVTARNRQHHVHFFNQLNAFFTIPI
ncbi:hypothetical protein DSUL_150108 [Desulfovibrionales bacterium]